VNAVDDAPVPAREALTAPPGSAWRDPVVWAIAAASFGAYFVISLYRLLQLTPSSYDLGIYTEFVKQLSRFHAPVVDILGSGYNLEGNHFQVAVGVIAPFFRLFPTPATLLFFQALFAALSVFPVVTVTLTFNGRSAGRLIGFGYAFSWGLQQMIAFDFHEIALAVPLLAFSVSALVRRRPGAVIGWAMPLVFVKEDQGFTVAAIGVLLGATAAFPRLLPAWPLPARSLPPAAPGPPARQAAQARWRPRRHWRSWRPVRLASRLLTGGDPWDYAYTALWGGLFLVAWGLFWSVFAITVIIPHFSPQHHYYFWKDGGALGGGKPFSLGALAGQFASGWPTKLQTVVLLLLPTAFTALGSPVALLTLPSLLLRFVSTNASFWGTAWHYNATVMPILFIAAAQATCRWRCRPGAPAGPRAGGHLRSVVHAATSGAARHGGAMMAAIAVALAFQFPLATLWHSSTYKLGAHVAAADAAMAVVPDGATVTTTLDLLAPLAARTDTFWIGTAGNPVTQYLVFDGANSGYYPPVTNVPAFIARWYGRDGYVQVFASGDVYVYRRG
jgi:uncharacterized membrane protein